MLYRIELLTLLLTFGPACNGSRNRRKSGAPVPPELSKIVMEDTTASSNMIRSSSHTRLPDTILPEVYVIKIDTQSSAYFSGVVTINLNVVKATNKITVHMKNITLLQTPQVNTHINGVSKSIGIMKNVYNPETQIQTIFLNETLKQGSTCNFTAQYRGTYMSNAFGLNQMYEEERGRKRRILATYLQPVGARLVFPCLDEPHLKAKFTLHVSRQKDEKVISNMPLNKTTTFMNNTKYVWDEFEKSLKMSTYLVAFVIFQFKNVKISGSGGKLIQVWTRNDMLADTMQAAMLASKSLDYFDKLLGVKYPLKKLDYVALPAYPVPGMENFGLVISREDAVLSNSFLYRKEWVSTVVAHETAHQWIGNLVTPSWWSQFWISEAFATYLSARALEKIDPSIEPINQFLVRETAWVRRQDNGDSATSLVIQPYDPLARNLKNIPMYYKGAAVVRMLSMIVGPQQFDTSLKSFFRKFQLQSVNQDDLFTMIANGTNVTLPTSLQKIMDTWTLQKGYPLLTVSQKSNGTITVRQEVFSPRNNLNRISKFLNRKLLWYIPLTFGSKSHPEFPGNAYAWLLPRLEEMVITKELPGSWLVLNSQQMVYARINYDKILWNSIAKQLAVNHSVIPVLNRAQLLDDSLHLFYSGYIGADIPMKLLSYLNRETNFNPWISALKNLERIEILIRNEKDYPIFQEYMLSQILPVLSSLGYSERPQDSHMTKKLRLYLLSWACKLQFPICGALAKASFANWTSNPLNTRVFPEFAQADYLCSAIYAGTEKDWLFLFKEFVRYQANNIKFEVSTPWERADTFLSNALACTRNKNIISRLLESLLHLDYNFSFEDVSLVINSLARSRLWATVSWNFLVLNAEAFIEKYGNLPVPFMVTQTDLFQFHRLGETFKDETEYYEHFQNVLKENRIYVAKNTRLINSLTKWLRHYKNVAITVPFP